MPDATDVPPKPGFPYLTALATVAGLGLFVGLGLLVNGLPDALDNPKPAEPAVDPAQRLADVQARNRAVLDGSAGGKMSLDDARTKLAEFGNANHRLPFPVEPAAEPKSGMPK